MIDSKLQEELRAKYNPEGSLLRAEQLRMLEMLKCIDNICKKHDISYWLSSGTLLGAVRHGGFIPWDDDLDIEMLRKDYNKFVKILANKEELEGRYELQDHICDEDYLFPFAKLRDLNSIIEENNPLSCTEKYKGIFIDIFPMEHNPQWLLKLSSGIQYRILCPFFLSCKIRFLRLTLKYIIMNLLYPFFRVCSVALNLCTKNTLSHTLGVSFYLNRRSKKDIFPLSTITFENNQFPSPHNVDSYLKKIYGNYWIVPSLKNRKYHSVNIKL